MNDMGTLHFLPNLHLTPHTSLIAIPSSTPMPSEGHCPFMYLNLFHESLIAIPLSTPMPSEGHCPFMSKNVFHESLIAIPSGTHPNAFLRALPFHEPQFVSCFVQPGGLIKCHMPDCWMQEQFMDSNEIGE